MISYLQFSILLCPIFVSVFSHFNSSERANSFSNYEESSLVPVDAERRLFSNNDRTRYGKLYPSSYSRNTGRSFRNRGIKTRREENSMSDFEEEHPGTIEKPLIYNYDYNYRPAPFNVGHRGYYGDPYGYSHHLMNDLREGKEALTLFGIGLLVGLGALGLLSGLLKLLLGPLAFGSLLSLLLVLAAPVPVVSTGKMLFASLPKIKLFGKLDLQDKLNEITKKLPALHKTPGPKTNKKN